jgi:hypothetical protein
MLIRTTVRGFFLLLVIVLIAYGRETIVAPVLTVCDTQCRAIR